MPEIRYEVDLPASPLIQHRENSQAAREIGLEASPTKELKLSDDYPGFLLAILPPGAFIGLGFLIAIKNYVDRHQSRQSIKVSAPTASTESPA